MQKLYECLYSKPLGSHLERFFPIMIHIFSCHHDGLYTFVNEILSPSRGGLNYVKWNDTENKWNDI